MIDLINARTSSLAELCRTHRVSRLSLFGSALRADFDLARSDLDFAVEFAAMTPSEHAAAYFGLAEDLERLFGRPVDLIETRAVRNPYRRREIEEHQATIYAAA